MEFLRQYSPHYFDGYTWDRGGYWYCPADVSVDQMLECLNYEPLDAVEWECKWADGDICKWREDR